MKILITGGAGYIGSHTIIDILANTSWEIISIDNFSNSTAQTFDRIKKVTGKKIKNYKVDLCDLKKTKEIFSAHPDISSIIHFAAFKSVPESVAKPQKYIRNNIEALNNILKCAKAFNIKQIVFSSSCAVYGKISKLPVNEHTPLNKALSPYGLTKQKGESILQNFSNKNPDFSIIVLRYFNPIGAHPSGLIGDASGNNSGSLMSDIINTAKGIDKSFIIHGNDYNTRDGTCIRDYVHVSDIANAHYLSLKLISFRKNNGKYEIINLGTGKGVSVVEALKAFQNVNKVHLNITLGLQRQGDIPAIYTSATKAKSILKWKPKYNLSDMMKSLWKWEANQ